MEEVTVAGRALGREAGVKTTSVGGRSATWPEVAGAGATGGLLFWAFALYGSGLPTTTLVSVPPALRLAVSLPVLMILGAGAAALTIYWIATTDTKQRARCLGFALACGFTAEPILRGVPQRIQQELRAADTRAAIAAAGAVTAAPLAGDREAVSRAGDVALALVENAGDVPNLTLRTEATEQAINVVKTLTGAPEENVAQVTGVLEKVGRAAVHEGQVTVLNVTLGALRNIESRSDLSAQHRSRATMAIRGLGAMEDPALHDASRP